MIAKRTSLSDEGGFSLVELAIYVVVFGIITATVAAVMVTLFRSEQAVSGITNSTSDSQNMVAFLSNDTRNSRQFHSASDGESVTLSVASRDIESVTWQCVRWSVKVTKKNRTVLREVKTDLTGSIWAVPPKGATFLSEAVRPKGSTAFFSGAAVMGMRGSLQYAMQVETSDKGVLDVSGQAGNTAQNKGASSYCF